MSVIYQVLQAKSDEKVWIKKVANHQSFIHQTGRTLDEMQYDFPDTNSHASLVDCIIGEVISHRDSLDWQPGDLYLCNVLSHLEIEDPHHGV